jgi:demethylmenaquinone methyltransferase/2-methoxy-6-polyprenyl-1,4-benzoquinol methylase
MDELTAQNPDSIQNMFGVISEKYDLANSVLSFGIHHRWKKKLVRAAQVEAGNQILDCATGTGDLAFLFEAALKGTGKVFGSDFCEPMLEKARLKAAKIHSQVQFEFADVMNLQYADHQFDIASISFGIRNVKDTKRALSELGRVVKPGGRLLVLEFGQPQSKVMGALFNFYSQMVLPKIGGWISGQPQAYRYLQTSSAAFPCGQEFLNLAKSTGRYSSLQVVPIQTGIAYLYILTR